MLSLFSRSMRQYVTSAYKNTSYRIANGCLITCFVLFYNNGEQSSSCDTAFMGYMAPRQHKYPGKSSGGNSI